MRTGPHHKGPWSHHSRPPRSAFVGAFPSARAVPTPLQQALQPLQRPLVTLKLLPQATVGLRALKGTSPGLLVAQKF